MGLGLAALRAPACMEPREVLHRRQEPPTAVHPQAEPGDE